MKDNSNSQDPEVRIEESKEPSNKRADEESEGDSDH